MHIILIDLVACFLNLVVLEESHVLLATELHFVTDMKTSIVLVVVVVFLFAIKVHLASGDNQCVQVSSTKCAIGEV